MARARALVAAVPQRVYTAVAGLVLLASLGVAVLLGAGLSTWQGAVRDAPRHGDARPPSVISPPRSAVIVVPTPHVPAPRVPPRRVTGVPGPAGSSGVSRVVTVPAAVVATSRPAPIPVGGTAAEPPSTVAAPRVAAAAPANSAEKHAAAGHHGNRGKHLGWTKGVRGAGHGRGHGISRHHG